MNNNYQSNLRTHYSPIRRNKNYINNYQSYTKNKCYDNKKSLNINTNLISTEIYPSKNKTPNKILVNKSSNFPYNNYHYKKKNINLGVSEKDDLNNSFSKINPYYFQDKVQSIEKDQINNKVKNRIHLQREAIKQLSLHKIRHPSQKEKLQKINEFSSNPMVSYENKHPFYKKTLDKYYYNENLIKKNLNLYDKPRKEIEDYYNICQYQTPANINIDSITHTKPNYIYPNYGKNKNDKKIKEELDKQVENKINKKRNKFIEEKTNGIFINKMYNDYEVFLKNKEKEEKLNKQKEINIDNDILDNYKQYEKKHLHDGEKDYMIRIRKKMEEEDFQRKYEEKHEKLKTMKNLREWCEINEKIKENKNNENIREKRIWKNYSEIYIIKCRHGKELYKCCRCGNHYSRDQVHKVIY